MQQLVQEPRLKTSGTEGAPRRPPYARNKISVSIPPRQRGIFTLALQTLQQYAGGPIAPLSPLIVSVIIEEASHCQSEQGEESVPEILQGRFEGRSQGVVTGKPFFPLSIRPEQQEAFTEAVKTLRNQTDDPFVDRSPLIVNAVITAANRKLAAQRSKAST